MPSRLVDIFEESYKRVVDTVGFVEGERAASPPREEDKAHFASIALRIAEIQLQLDIQEAQKHGGEILVARPSGPRPGGLM